MSRAEPSRIPSLALLNGRARINTIPGRRAQAKRCRRPRRNYYHKPTHRELK